MQQEFTYITERCVLRLEDSGLVATESAPGTDLERDVLGQTRLALGVSPAVRTMDARFFHPDPIGLTF